MRRGISGSAEPFRGIHKGISPCVGKFEGAKPRQIYSATMNMCIRANWDQNLSQEKNKKEKNEKMFHMKHLEIISDLHMKPTQT